METQNEEGKEEQTKLSAEEIMERLGRLNRYGTSIMCRPTFPSGPSKWYVNMENVQIPVHTADMSGSTPENAVFNAWEAITDSGNCHTLIRYFCGRNEPIPGNGPQVWVIWSQDRDDWEDVAPPQDAPLALYASKIMPYAEHRSVEGL